MTPLRIALSAAALLQIVLGFAYGLAPQALFAWMGHSAFAPDLAYPLGMLASRFWVYGALLALAAVDPRANRRLVDGMIAIQAIDLGFGLWFTAAGVVPLGLSLPPMLNAVWILVTFLLWRPASTRGETKVAA
ncbi:MAG: hypothetical protein LWW93_12290 [Hyphomicrobiales bacterium]|nr:hypothetical protein [Hyphomicrobiales bacterium]